MSHRNRIVIGPSMSPTPESEDSESAQRSRKVIGPSMSPTPESEDRDAAPIATTAAALPIDNDLPSPDERSSKKKRRKKKDKRRKSLDSVTLVEDAAAAGIDEAGAHESTKRGSREKRKRKKSRKNHPDPGEANALTDGSDPDSPIKSVEESPSSPKRKNKRSKNKATHGDELPLRDGMQEEGLVNGDFTYGEAGPAQNDDFPAHAPGISQSPKSARKKRGRGRKEDDPGGAPTSDAHQALLSHAIGGSPPSAQPPRVDDILKYEPLVEDDEVEASVVPDSQWQQPQDLRFHFTGIPANFADAVTDPVAEARRENDPQSGLGWLHKRENALQDTPVTNSRGTLLDTALPDLQPIQVKIEPQSGSDSNDSTDSESSSSSDESNSQSPSVQRLERLSRSRSRSTSRAPSRSGFLADQTLGLVATARPDPYEGVPYSAPSSTGSNRSIPARLPSPSSTGSNRSIPAVIQPRPSPLRSESSRSSVSRRSDRASRDDALGGTDAMDIDQLSAQDPNSPKTKKAILGKKKGSQAEQLDKAEAGMHGADMVDQITSSQVAKSKKRNRKGDSIDNLADMSVHLIANGVSSPVRGPQQPGVEAPGQHSVSDDELPLGGMPATTEIVSGPSTSQPAKTKRRQPKASLIPDQEAPDSAVEPQDVGRIPESIVENGEPTTSPKKKAKNSLPRTAPIDVTEVELEPANGGQTVRPEPAVAETATATRNDSVGPGESASQPQTKPKLKGKKKRILNQPKVSLSLSQMEGDEEDEDFSTTFARRKSGPQPTAGPSNEPEQSQVGGSQATSPEKPRKPKRKRRTGASEDEMDSLLAAGPSRGRKSNNLGLSDDDREAKRKRLSTPGKGKATGAWTQDELNALGKVVADFMEEHGLSQQELNQLVQAVPNKAESTNKDFWDKAEQAIPQRTRKQITERARRIYHNFVARGTWTQEQKDEVHELFETHPKKWTEIAAMIKRDSKDVRDYWRNSYLVLESQIKSRWSKEEEERLREVMEEALSKIRIVRENNDQPLRNSRGKSVDDEAMIDWQQISAAMDLTRSRQQCKWKWVDMREKGLVGDDSLPLPTQPRSSAGPSGNKVNGISEDLANAREDYRGMGPEEKYRLIDAIKDSGAREDKFIPWRTLVDERFRTKWHRPVLRLTWYRLRQTVPGYQDQDVEANARFLVNYYHMYQMFPRFDDNAIDEQMEETVIHYNRGKRIWKRPSSDLRAVRERQRRSSSASSRASSRLSRKVSSEILNLSGDEDGPSGSRQSAELGEERGRPRAAQHRDGLKGDEVSVNIPGHLQGEAAKKALVQARAKAKSKKGRKKELANGESRRVRSNSVALDSDSE